MSEKQLLQKALLALQDKNKKIEAYKKAATEPIAVIGMACRFPGGVDNPEKYWELLNSNKNPVKKYTYNELTVSRKDNNGVENDENISAYLSLLDEVDTFDARFFRISAKEAKCMDPQHRLLLEVCWEALEDAGNFNHNHEEQTGIFVGVASSDYAQLLTHSLDINELNSFFTTGNLPNAAAGRISYNFGFKGPSIAIDTACSSSLVSVHMACQSLRNNECRQAMAGGVNLILNPFGTHAAQQSEMLSEDGKSKSFDDKASGYVRGEGCGMVVLKRYSDAVKDGDHIHALIMSSGVAQAGTRGGLTVPNGRTQQELINQVLNKSGVPTEAIGYIEAHGSATPLGDTIELGALSDIFRKSHHKKENPLYIGAVKSNIGNLEVAAGIAGLMKTILALKKKAIPANLHINEPTSQLDWQNTPLQLVQKNIPWNANDKQRFASVNALGFSGTNAHLIIGEYIEKEVLTNTSNDKVEATKIDRPVDVLCISAKNKEALQQLVAKYIQFLQANPETSLTDFCYTANAFRKHFEHRLSVSATSVEELVQKLQDYQVSSEKDDQNIENDAVKTAFYFSSHHNFKIKDAGSLIASVPVFKEKLIAINELLTPLLEELGIQKQANQHVFSDFVKYPGTTTFIQQYALAEMWQNWGIVPSAVAGEGVGELVAANLAGIVTLEDALKIMLHWDHSISGADELPLESVKNLINQTTFEQPQIHFITGKTEELTSSAYWTSLLEESQESVLKLDTLKEQEIHVIFEIGISNENNQWAHANYDLLHLPVHNEEKVDWATITGNISLFYERGGMLNWKNFYQNVPVHKISIPTYPFQRKPYWFNATHSYKKVVKKDHTNSTLQNTTAYSGSIPEQVTFLIADLLEESVSDINAKTPLIELGADSIMITQAIKKIKNHFGVEVPLRSLYDDLKDIASLAAYIEQNLPAEGSQVLEVESATTESQFKQEKDTIDFDELIQKLANEAWQLSEKVNTETEKKDYLKIFKEKATEQLQELGMIDAPEALSAANQVISVPLTVAQQQLVRLSHIDEGGWIAYNFSSNMVLDGDLQIPLIKEVIERLIKRHESLRTVLDADQKNMKIHPSLPASYEWKDYSEYSPEDAQKQLNLWNLEESKKPFSLENPFYRFSLLKLNDKKHVLSLSVHHVLFDGWSIVILLKEFASIYASLYKRHGINLETPMQFRELVQLRASQDSSRIKKAETYWMNKFSNSIPTLDLPLDFPRPPVKTYVGTKYKDDISEEVIEGIKALGQQHQTTLFATMLAAYTLFLQKLSQQQDFVIGIPYSGRFLNGSETVVGYCSQLLPISSSFKSETTFAEHLKNTQKLLLEGFVNEDFPFSELVDRLKEKANIINNPLARATFNMNPVKFFPDVENLEAGFAPTPLSYVAYDLTLTILEMDNGYKVEWNYNTDLFKEASIVNFSKFFKYLLSQLLKDPTQKIEKLSLLEPQTEIALQTRWETNKTGQPEAKTLQQLFEQQALATPNREAVQQENTVLTYQGLNQKANQWCAFLKKQGINETHKVGVLLDKSSETIAILLGILKAGATFVSIDVSMPKFKLDHILEDTQPELLLSKAGLLTAYEVQDKKIIDIDKVVNDVVEMPTENPSLAIPANEVAYIVYTSGSTGKPKGIMAKHQGIVNYLKYLHNTLELNQEDVVLQLAPLGFDASIRDTFGPLTTGAKVVLTADSRDFSQLATDIQNHRITCLLSTVPSLLAGLTTEMQTAGNLQTNLRMILVSGEVLTTPIATKVLETFNNVALYNQYGPTECTMTSTYYQVPAGKSKLQNTQPIGKPIPNAEVYIINNGKLVPDGIIGEICIGGVGLAKSYLNLPDLTAEKFKTFFKGTAYEKRLYTTGDLGRFSSTGELEFFGRKDNQLKIRGFRVELSEIETVILKYNSIKSCAVVPKQEEAELVLHAYVSTEQEDITVNELLDFLRKYLPEYALPAKFITLEELPLTVNGKVDRKALLHKGSEVKSGSTFSKPANEIEESLLEIWKQVLQKEDISTQDEFFNIGGNSLKAIQLIGRINKKHKKLLTVANIFTNQTIRKLALQLEKTVQKEETAITALPVKESYDLSYAQRSLWIMDQLEENQIAYNISGKVLYEEKVDYTAFKQAFETLVKRHESLRTIFITEGDVPKQKILPWEETGFNVEYTDLSNANEHEKQLQINLAEEQTAFQLDKGPLLRVKLLKLAEEKFLILISTHHIIADGWSMNVLLNEVLTLYKAYQQKQPNPLSPLQIHFKDYVAWHNKRLQGEGLTKLSSFWAQYLEGALSLIELPFDKKRPEKPAFNGATIDFNLEENLTTKIDSLIKENKTTLFTALLTMVKLLLYRYSGQNDLIVGIPIASRDRKELENQIGFYINTTALRTKFTAEDSVKTLLQKTGKNMLEVQQHSLYPFNLLMEDLENNGNLSGNNLFNVMIQIQDTHQGLVQEAAVGQIRETIMGTNNTVSKFDLTFNFTLLDDGRTIPVWIEYNTDLFFKDTITKMKDDLLFLIDKITTDTQVSINEQSLLPLYEKADLLDDFLKPLDEF